MQPQEPKAAICPPNARERRAHPRLSVDAAASLYLVDLGVRLQGKILNLSANGCHIQTERRFSTGIYRRVEIEFCLRGFPFRLAGVTQGIYGKHDVGVRFVSLSSRKQDQLEQALGEIAEEPSPGDGQPPIR